MNYFNSLTNARHPVRLTRYTYIIYHEHDRSEDLKKTAVKTIDNYSIGLREQWKGGPRVIRVNCSGKGWSRALVYTVNTRTYIRAARAGVSPRDPSGSSGFFSLYYYIGTYWLLDTSYILVFGDVSAIVRNMYNHYNKHNFYTWTVKKMVGKSRYSL